MRLFAGLDIPEDVHENLATLVAKLQSTCHNARWVRTESLHITLKFIGEVSPDKARTMKAALAGVRFPAPIPLRFAGLGFFPNSHRPRVLWAGVKAGPGLAMLARSVETALSPFGISREEHLFSPHLTLARFNSPDKLAGLHSAIHAIEDGESAEFGAITAKQFHLYQSVLKPGGSEYTRLATFSFVGSEPE